MRRSLLLFGPVLGLSVLPACDPEKVDLRLDAQAHRCVALQRGNDWLVRDGAGFAWQRKAEAEATRFRLQPSALSTYLLYDPDGGYLVSESGPISRQTTLHSDLSLVQDGYVSGAEWVLGASPRDPSRYTLKNRRNNGYLAETTLVGDPEEADRLELVETTGCATHPELSLDATGTVTRTTWEDGDLYGIVDAHSHIRSDLAFGGALYHGAPFHRLGVTHALADCATYHGEMGRQDFFGYAFDSSGNNTTNLIDLVADLAAGTLSVDNHHTDGWPTFTDWPDAPRRSTHQVQYYRWLERAWMGGLRLVVQHATSNAVNCTFSVGEGLQPARYDCEDMTAVDRIIDGTWEMQDYVDAVSGGAGKGWFRVVRTPAEAREVISAGKMAVVLGIEASDLFDCHLTARPGAPACDEAFVDKQLDDYYARGVRAVFPVHKYDNTFSPGDGSGDFIEVGNFLNSGHWTNQTEDCPELSDGGFDGGSVTFSGLLQPRDTYLSDPPNDLSAYGDDPLNATLAYADLILSGPVEGDYCQKTALTPIGEHLIEGMMDRGMIIEVDHLPKWSYIQTFEILEANDYPAAGTHGRQYDGRIYALGGISTVGLGRCQNPEDPGSTLRGYLERIDLAAQMGGYPGLGFGLDLNGFAGAAGPRFGDRGCGNDQPNPMTYPFESYAGDVQFTEPYVGERRIDFDTEGLVHIGLLPELIQDARVDAVSDADLEPLFRSAEGWVRMWEKAEARGKARSGG